MTKSILIASLLFVSMYSSELTPQETLGKSLFFDKNLSKNKTMACATCHNPDMGFTDHRGNGVSNMASLGDNGKSVGGRNAPTASYANQTPSFHYDKKEKAYVGGQFWDGRASTLEDQAGGPPLNPVEMEMPNEKTVMNRVLENPYYVSTFKDIYGKDIFKDPKKAFAALTKSIASFERTSEFSPFDSKYDRFLRDEYDLTPLEDLGKALFFSNNNNSCSSCHVLKGEDKEGETFTNFQYHNIGVPVNHALNKKSGTKNADEGLLANPAVTDVNQKGKFKVPTLRNVAVTGPYMHNGVFKDLRTVVEFYDKYNNQERTINPETGKKWADPEVAETISKEKLKAKKLTDRKVDALIAFMKILTDKKYEHLIKE
jgi:cytochrome c peroxidase